jgi:tetratricopeptide (TPR) repeat protein
MAVGSFAETAHEYNEAGIRYMKSREYKDAVYAFEAACARDPDNETIKKNLTLAYAALANEYAERGNWVEAIRLVKQAHKLDNTNHVLKKNLSVLYNNYAYEQMKEDMPDNAYVNLKEALYYDKDNWAAYVALGRIMYDQGEIEEAVKYWTEAVSINPELTVIKQQLDRLKKESSIEDKFREKNYMYFEVKYEGYEREDLALKVLEILHEAYTKIGYDFRYYPFQKIPVIIYTKEQFQEMTGTPDWIGGLFDGIIRVTASTIEGEDDRLRNILYHEYTHAVLYKKTGNNLPRWLNEGLAQYEEPVGNDIQRDDIIFFKRYLSQGNLIALTDLDKALTHRENKEQLGLAYLQAKLLVQYINELYYFYRIVSILDGLASGMDIDTALQETLFVDTERLGENWLEWLNSKYK